MAIYNLFIASKETLGHVNEPKIKIKKSEMGKNSIVFIVLMISIFLMGCKSDNQPITDKVETQSSTNTEINYYTQGSNNRTAAEWEPALGTLIVWPLSIPYKLVVELANDNHLYTMVENETARKEAEKWYHDWHINLDDVTFIYAKQGVDAWWTRDWGPSAVFTPSNEYQLADGKYIYATPVTDMACNDSLRFLYFDEDNKMKLTQTDDDASIPLASQLGYDLLDLPFNNTGGNVSTDGLGTAFSTCVIYAENDFHGIDNQSFLQLNDSLLGIRQYNILSNFENYGIQHIDCLLKLIDEETFLVAEPPSDHELFDTYNKIITEELAKLKTPYGRPYKILRIKTARYYNEELAAYTNSLILNKTIYVPLFDIDQDQIAIRTWQDAMPGYTVKGFKFHLEDEQYVTDKMKNHYRNGYGWNSGDALHCRTRAIWDPNMIFVSVKRVDSESKADQANNVYATIIDYSGKGLIKEKCQLLWRISNEPKWNSIALKSTENPNHFFAQLPSANPGTIIEYYISATSSSGEQETRPKIAPTATYEVLTIQ